MPRDGGLHQRQIRVGRLYRGSKKRVARISPLTPLPIEVWLILGVALVIAGITVALIYDAM